MIGGDSGLQRLGARNYDTIACMIVCWSQSMPTVGHRRMYVKATYNIHVWRPIYGLKQQHARTDLQTRPITTTIHGKYKLRNTPKLFPAIYVVNHVFLCIWLCDLMHICKTKKKAVVSTTSYHLGNTGTELEAPRTCEHVLRFELISLVYFYMFRERLGGTDMLTSMHHLILSCVCGLRHHV
jgi:hypothetical protein